MVTWQQVQSWNPSDVHRLAESLARTSAAWDGLIRRLAEVMPTEWTGEAATAATDQLVDVSLDARRRLGTLATIGRCVTDVAESMYPLVACARETEDTATGNRFAIDADGEVRDLVGAMASASGDMWGIVRERRRMHVELSDRIGEILRSATELDDNAADLLRDLDENEVDPELRVVAASVPTEGSPSANAAYWQGLPQSAKTALLVTSPESIGNLDGIPAQVRDAANRAVLAKERVRLQQVEQALESELDANTFGGWLSNADAGLEQTRARLRAIDAVTATLEQGDRQLLVLDDSSYDDTMAAIAVGNVDTATHVAVFVPGLSSTVEGSTAQYDGTMDDLKDAVEQQLSDPTKSVACVTWMDYRAPQLGWDLLDPDGSVASPNPAVAGGGRLAEFLDGLDAMRSTDAHLSVLGHSYGSLTAAKALGYDTGVDEFVAMGSPGLGLSDVSSMSVPAGHTFVAEADDDMVADLGAFGPDPSRLRGVDALATGDDGTHHPSEGHSGYLDDGSVGQWGAAAVVAGRPPTG